jgi:hypothetical protein
VILPDGALEGVIGVTGFPTAAVFHGRELQWKGSAGSSGSALGKVQKVGSKSSIYPKKLSKIFKAMDKGDSAKALEMLRSGMEKFEGRDLDWAKRLDTFLIESSERAFKAAEGAIEEGYWFKALGLVQPYLGKDSPFPGAADAALRFEKLEGEELYSKEIAGGKLFAEAKALEGEGLYLEAAKAYKSVLKKCKETKISDHAHKAVQALIDAKKPGFKDGCRKCELNKGAACEKHHVEVKL